MSATSKHLFSRRSFLKAGAVGVAAAGLGLRPTIAAEKAAKKAAKKTAGKKIPIGLQLYSVREQCAKDLPAVLEAVGKMGYNGVEFAGYYDRGAKELRKLLDDNGLVCCGTHTALNTLTGDALQGTIEFNRTIGNRFLIVPSMPAKLTASREAWIEAAKLFSELSDKVKAEKMRVGYHAHGGDFKKFDGEFAWDIFFGAAKPEVVMQLDLGNCIDGGGDPVAELKKFPGRATTIHLKEHGGPATAVIGEGDVNWKEIFALCEAGGTQWYIVEHERGGPDPIGDVRRCLEGLRKMGK
jgi:sugar phosphate isomerase/epimerase